MRIIDKSKKNLDHRLKKPVPSDMESSEKLTINWQKINWEIQSNIQSLVVCKLQLTAGKQMSTLKIPIGKKRNEENIVEFLSEEPNQNILGRSLLFRGPDQLNNEWT